MIPCLPLAPCEPADEAPAGAVSDATRAADPGVLPAEWFRDHVQNLWRFVLRLGVPRHAIDDLVQEAFIIATLDALGIESNGSAHGSPEVIR